MIPLHIRAIQVDLFHHPRMPHVFIAADSKGILRAVTFHAS